MRFLFILTILILTTAEAEAAPRAKKDISASSAELGPKPVKAADILLGLRAGQVGAYQGELTLGASVEYMYNSEFGFGGQLVRASYSRTITMDPIEAKVEGKAIVIAATGNWHPNFIRVPAFDPFVSVGIAHSFVKSSASITKAPAQPDFSGIPGMPKPEMPKVEVDGDSTYLIGSLNGRYFVDKNLSVIGSLGFGLSTFTIGMDYLF